MKLSFEQNSHTLISSSQKLVGTMLNHTLPLLVSLHSLTFCLETILDKSKFETVALVNLNTTVDMGENLHRQLVKNTDYAWMRFDMTNSSKLRTPFMMNNLFTRIFFVYFLDNFVDWKYVIKFIIATQLNYRDDHIYVVNQYPTIDSILIMGANITQKNFFNSGIFFLNTSGHGTGLEVYTVNGFRKGTIKIPLVDDQCSTDIYKKIFFDKISNFYGLKVVGFAQSEPPRIVRTSNGTVTFVDGEYVYSAGGHDVLIIDEVLKHLNSTPSFQLLKMVIYMLGPVNFTGTFKPEDSAEQRVFNVLETTRYNWKVPRTDEDVVKPYLATAVDLNTQQMRYSGYMEVLRAKDFTYLYPHDTENFVIIVPKRFKSKTEYDQLLKSPLILVWAPVTVAATITRFIFNKIKNSDKNIVDIYLQTFGLSLGMSFNAVLSSAAENLLLWWFCLSTMLSGMLLSSSMFQGFALQLNILTINNLKELEISGLEIQAPIYSESVRNFFENVPFQLNVSYTWEYEISDMIANRDTSKAYVIREGKYNILFGNDNDVWHIIQRLGYEYLSYKLRFFSSVERRVNTVLQRFVDHGIIKYLVAKNRRLLIGIKPMDRKVISTAVKPLTNSELQNSYLLYAFGIALSTVTFIAERIHFKRNATKRVPVEQSREVK